jgi:hypothetical protein
MTPLVARMTTTRRHLLEWVQAAGLVALDAVFREDAEALAGAKGKRTPTRTHHHWGTTARELTFGGRRLSVSCPEGSQHERHPEAVTAFVLPVSLT